MPNISISIVSHLQINLVKKLIEDIEKYCSDLPLEVILTLNVSECLSFSLDYFSFPIKLICNDIPLGFGANHNQAFTYAGGRYFCVMNPDIRLNNNPFNILIFNMSSLSVGVVAPLVLSEEGAVEDSARYFPSPLKIICKVFGKCREADYVIVDEPVYPDWVGGMFMLYPRAIFKKLQGFDENYFLYYEDVDICGRLRLLGYEVLLCPQAKVVHQAQRSSHRNLNYFRMHLTSMLRFFLSTVYWRLQLRKLLGSK